MEKLQEILELLNFNYPKENENVISALQMLQESLGEARDEMGKNSPKLLERGETEKIIKQTNQANIIIEFIKDIENITKKYSLENNYYNKEKKERGIEYHSLNENFTRTKPLYIIISNRKIKGKSWREILHKSCLYFKEVNENKFYNLAHKEDIPLYFKHNSLHSPKTISTQNGKLYLELLASANRAKNIIGYIAMEYGMDLDEIKLVLKEEPKKYKIKNDKEDIEGIKKEEKKEINP